jgi:hypothetical protein
MVSVHGDYSPWNHFLFPPNFKRKERLGCITTIDQQEFDLTNKRRKTTAEHETKNVDIRHDVGGLN